MKDKILSLPPIQATSVALDAADILRKTVLKRLFDGGDDFPGSEADISAELGISRPSLRQATRMLEAEQILVIKRGVGGGIYLRKPGPDYVARTVSQYLTARSTPLREVWLAQIPMRTEIVRLVAANPDINIRDKPAAFIAANEAKFAKSGEEFVQIALTYANFLSGLAGNPTLALLNELLQRHTAGLAAEAIEPGKWLDYAKSLRSAATAIADGDVDAAVRLTRQGIDNLSS